MNLPRHFATRMVVSILFVIPYLLWGTVVFSIMNLIYFRVLEVFLYGVIGFLVLRKIWKH